MQADSAYSLIQRRNLLREEENDKRINRFTSIEMKNKIWNSYDLLLSAWDFELGSTYYALLNNQVKGIVKYIAENGATTNGIVPLINGYIDRNTKKEWKEYLVDLYISQTIDFAYFQIDLLMPEEIKTTTDNYVFTPQEQERLERARRRRPRTEVIQDGYYPLRKQGRSLPINQTKYNRSAKSFVENRLNQSLSDMSNTMRKNVNTAIRKSYDEAIELGLTGKDFEKHMQKGISKSLGKKNLGRAMNIARTEGTALSNWGMEESAKATGLILKKEWITRRDGLVRDAHLYMDGIQIQQDNAFSVQGYDMLRPGDSSGGAPAGLVCNCRCTLVFHEEKI